MKVAIAIIRDRQKQILITQRPLHLTCGGLWEFPGGKIEENESPKAALIREIKEELGIDVLQPQFLKTIDYPENSLQLFIFNVNYYIGTPNCFENQLALRWVSKSDLNPELFPKANTRIFELIDL